MDPLKKQDHNGVYDPDSPAPITRPNLRIAHDGPGDASQPKRGHLSSVPTGDALRDAEDASANDTRPDGRPNLKVLQGGGGGKTSGNVSDAASRTSGRDSLATRGALKDREGDSGGLYKPYEDTMSKPLNFLRLSGRRRKLAAAGILSSIVGLGSGFGLLGQFAGPAQFIQASKLLSGFHLQDKDDQLNVRLMSSIRAIRNFQRGTPENSRLGYLGNKVADRAEARFNKVGFESKYDILGTFRGYTVDPKLVQGGVFDKYTDRSPEGLKTFLKTEFGITADIIGNRVVIDATRSDFTYKANKSLMKHILKASGSYYGTTSIFARYAGQRTGIGRGWHPIKKLDRKATAAFSDRIGRLNFFNKERKDYAQKGTGALKIAGTGTEKDEEGNSQGSADQDANDAQSTADDAEAARSDEAAKERLRSNLTAKLGAGVGALIGLFCILLAVESQVDKINRDNIERPSQRLFVEMLALGSQVMAGNDLDGETEQLGFYSAHMVDKENKTTFFDAKSIHAEQGKPGGTDISGDMKTTLEDNPITKILNATGVKDQLTTACKILGSTIGTIIMTGIGLAGGPISFIITSIIQAIGQKIFIDILVNILTGDQVDPTRLYGAAYGGVANQGGRFFGNNVGASMAGLPLTTAQSAVLREETMQDQLEEFQSQDLAYRLFSPDDPRSFMGQVLQNQRPDARENISMYAVGLLNLGQNIGSTLGNIFSSAIVGAAPRIPYDYGVMEVAFSAEELSDPAYSRSDENEQRATNLLDNDTSDPSLVDRAKVCFGATLEKRSVSDPDRTDLQVWSVIAPKEGEEPITKRVLEGRSSFDDQDTTDYRCMDKDNAEWKTIRFFIADSQAMNAYACYDGNPKDPDIIQACVDAGQDPPGGYTTGSVIVPNRQEGRYAFAY